MLGKRQNDYLMWCNIKSLLNHMGRAATDLKMLDVLQAKILKS